MTSPTVIRQLQFGALETSHRHDFHHDVWTSVDWLGTGEDNILTFSMCLRVYVCVYLCLRNSLTWIADFSEGLLSR